MTIPKSRLTLERRAQVRALARANIERRAWYDALTGLPNRLLFSRRVESAIQDAGTGRAGFAVLALDLDFFGAVNESFGHAAGDELLRRLAPRLMRALGPRDTVCRVEADRFLVLLGEAFNSTAACRFASRLMVMLSRPLLIAGQQLSITASLGVSLYPDHASNAAELMSRASLALSEAKREGPASIRVYGEGEELKASA